MTIKNFDKIKTKRFTFLNAELYVSDIKEHTNKYHIQISDFHSNSKCFDVFLIKKEKNLHMICEMILVDTPTHHVAECTLTKNQIMNIDSFLISIEHAVLKNDIMKTYLHLITETQNDKKKNKKLKLANPKGIFGIT